MPRTTYDAVDATIAPHLVHFAQTGVSPEVHRIVGAWDDPEGLNDLEEIPDELKDRTNVQLETSFIEGERWSTWLEEGSPQTLDEIAQQLGWNIGYVARRGVVHRDLHVNNVWIEEGTERPVITDWELAYVDNSPEKDMQQMLSSTRTRLEQCGRRDLYPRLEDAYLTGFRDGLTAEARMEPDEVERAYRSLLDEYRR